MIGSKAVQPFLDWFHRLGEGFSFGAEALFVLCALVFILVWGLSLGRTKSVISLLSIYVGFAIATVFPYYQTISTSSPLADEWMRVGLFGVSVVAVFLIFTMSFLRKRLSSGEYNLIGVLVITTLQIGLLISCAASFMPANVVVSYLGSFASFFVGPALFAWFVAPLGGLLLLGYVQKG